jgi:hypothetical protein
MTGHRSLVALGAAALVVGGGIFAGIDLGGGKAVKPPKAPRPHARRAPLGPVHGLMLVPLADPDGHIPTADLKR